MRRLIIAVLLLVVAACTPAPEPTPVAMIAPNQLIGFWQTVSDTPSGAFEAQPWQFVGAQGDAIRLQLESSSAGVTLALQAPDGEVLARGNDIRHTLPADGVYTALVRFAPGEATPYNLTLEYTDRFDPSKPTPTPTLTLTPVPTVTPLPTNTPTPAFEALGALNGRLNSGDSRDGAISRASEQHVYLFDGEAGQFVSVRMARLSGSIDPVVTLYDSNGVALAMDDNSGSEREAYLRNYRLPASGEYTVQAGGDGGTGEYRISLTSGAEREPITPVIPEPTPTTIPSATPAPREDTLVDHLPVPGRIERPGGFARYPIIVEAGQAFTVGVSPAAGSPLRPVIELYSPSGELVRNANIHSSGAGGDAIIAGYRAAETGTYIALVQDEGNAVGDFVIGFGLGASYDSVLRGEANAELPVTGEVPKRGLRDVWTIRLNRDDVITLTANPSSATFDPAVEIVAPDGTLIAADDNGGGGRVPLITRLRAPESGLYAVRVTGANGGSSGVYTLLWRYVVVAPTATPPAASILLLSADDEVPRQTYAFYPFQGFAGQRVFIRANATQGSQLDPVIALLDAGGTVLAEADDHGDNLNPVLEWVLPADGTYIVRVNGYGESSGAFDLRVEALY